MTHHRHYGLSREPYAPSWHRRRSHSLAGAVALCVAFGIGVLVLVALS